MASNANISIDMGLLVQDIGLTEPSSRTRVGASATIAWPVLLMISSKEITSFSELEIIGPFWLQLLLVLLYLFKNRPNWWIGCTKISFIDDRCGFCCSVFNICWRHS